MLLVQCMVPKSVDEEISVTVAKTASEAGH